MKAIYSGSSRQLAGLLKKARESASMSQEDAAKFLRRSQSYISKIETGQLRVTVVELKAFAKVYRKNLDYFL